MNEFIDEDLYEYLLKHSSEEPKHLKKLNKETHLKILNPREREIVEYRRLRDKPKKLTRRGERIYGSYAF